MPQQNPIESLSMHQARVEHEDEYGVRITVRNAKQARPILSELERLVGEAGVSGKDKTLVYSKLDKDEALLGKVVAYCTASLSKGLIVSYDVIRASYYDMLGDWWLRSFNDSRISAQTRGKTPSYQKAV
ncbi:hypothetical protein HY493_04495 [Candidatus Woesearchaeota archaeon]|nr:hypothetical protein [Candidatus Woesearchaeota archaeon]